MGFKRGQLIRNPTSEIDNNIVWIIGAIEEKTEQEIEGNEKLKFFIVVVSNRKAKTINNVLNDYIAPNTHIKSNGYPSYPPQLL